MPYSTSGTGQGRRNVSPYITSPFTETGNVKESAISDMLRADNVTGTMDYSIAANMLKNTEIKNFFHASNIDCEVNNLIPALLTHSNKVCNFDALFNMAPVVNVKFFLGLIFTEVELRQLSEGLFYQTSDDRPTTGAFQRLEKQPMRNGEEAGTPWTAYGVHIVVILVLAAFLGENMSNSCDCAAEVASTITKSLMQQAPPAMLHPSGTDLLLRGFKTKNITPDTLHVPVRRDRVQSAFFHRHVNDTSLMKTNPTMSVLDSPLQPFMMEDMIHVQWTEFLVKCHLQLVQDWDHGCVVYGDEVDKRGVEVNKKVGTMVLSDIYRSLDPSKIPCNDTLLYGVYYPIIGTGTRHTHLKKYKLVQGWVFLVNADDAVVFTFQTDSQQTDEASSRSDNEGDNDGAEGASAQQRRSLNVDYIDPGCREHRRVVPTKDVFAYLRSKSFLVQPLVARPGATLFDTDRRCFGTLQYNERTGQCYNPLTGKYTMRCSDASELSIDTLDGGLLELSPIEIETRLLGVPTILLVDTRAFVVDGVPDRRLPIGAGSKTYLRCNLWYCHSEVEYVKDFVYLLVHKSGANSTSFATVSCHVSFLVHSTLTDPSWEIISSIRPCD